MEGSLLQEPGFWGSTIRDNGKSTATSCPGESETQSHAQSQPSTVASLRVCISAASSPSTVLGEVRAFSSPCSSFPLSASPVPPFSLLSPWVSSASVPSLFSLCLRFSLSVSQPLLSPPPPSALCVSLFSPSLLSFISPPTPPPPVGLGTRQKP